MVLSREICSGFFCYICENMPKNIVNLFCDWRIFSKFSNFKKIVKIALTNLVLGDIINAYKTY